MILVLFYVAIAIALLFAWTGGLIAYAVPLALLYAGYRWAINWRIVHGPIKEEDRLQIAPEGTVEDEPF